MNVGYDLANGLQYKIQQLKNNLPSLQELKISGEFYYGCCGKPIVKPNKDIQCQEMCPYCLDFYETIDSFSDSYGWRRTIKFRQQYTPESKYEEPFLSDDGKPLFKGDGNKDSDKTKDSQLIATKDWFSEKFGTLRFQGKVTTVKFSNQREFDIISNIIEMSSESMNSFGIYGNLEYSQFRQSLSFGSAEIDYINEKKLSEEFSYIMSVKQILINRILVDAVNDIFKKLGNAGMALL